MVPAAGVWITQTVKPSARGQVLQRPDASSAVPKNDEALLNGVKNDPWPIGEESKT